MNSVLSFDLSYPIVTGNYSRTDNQIVLVVNIKNAAMRSYSEWVTSYQNNTAYSIDYESEEFAENDWYLGKIIVSLSDDALVLINKFKEIEKKSIWKFGSNPPNSHEFSGINSADLNNPVFTFNIT